MEQNNARHLKDQFICSLWNKECYRFTKQTNSELKGI